MGYLDMIIENREDIHSNLIKINEEYWWHTEDIPAYEYLVNTNKDFMNKIIPYLSNNKVAVQAGGHCGWMVKEINKHIDTIYTFEPNYLSFLCLTLNCPEENIFKFQLCVGNEHKLVDMVNHAGGVGANYVNGSGKIPMLKIDDLNLEACDFMQLDLEGYEYNAMLGAENTIKKFKPILCLERYWGESRGFPEAETDRFLINLGYSLVDRIGDSDHVYKVI